MKNTRVVLADADTFSRLGTRVVFMATPDIVLLDEACDKEETLRVVKQQKPDILILGTNLPNRGSVEVVQRIHEEEIVTRILIIHTCCEHHLLEFMPFNKIVGCISKKVAEYELIAHIRNIAYRDFSFSWPTNNKELTQFSGCRGINDILTRRELEVVNLIGLGYSNKEIAENLSISPSTVKNHTTRIYHKLDLKTRVEVANWSWQYGKSLK